MAARGRAGGPHRGPLVDSIVSVSQDASYSWILVVDQDRTISAHRDTPATGQAIGDFRDVIAADWQPGSYHPFRVVRGPRPQARLPACCCSEFSPSGSCAAGWPS